jgi:hypothetical protein
MFQKEFIKHLENELISKDIEIARLNNVVFELIDKLVFKEQPQRIIEAKTQRLNNEPKHVLGEDDATDPLSTAMRAAEQAYLEKNNNADIY